MVIKIFTFLFLLGFTINTYAHPLDISNTTIGIKDKNAYITTYFHSFEINYLLKKNGININSIDEYFKNKNIIKNYIKNTFLLKNNDIKCNINNFEFSEDEIYKILTDGLKVKYKINCKQDINKIDLKITFFSNFPLQTNRVKIYNLNKSTDTILYKVLTPKIDNIKINDLKNFKNKQSKDSDCDGLSDEEEKVYKTDPLKVDTDGDNYSDYEEVTGGWNPINKEYGPGQDYKEKLSPISCNNQKIINTNNKYINLDTSNYGNEYLKKVLKYINKYVNNEGGNIIYIFFIVYILGIIHAIGPGHSKSLLVAYTIEKGNGYKKGFLYALIFSITHIIDILLLFLLTTIAFHYINVDKYNYLIQLISISILFLFAIYLVYKAFFKKTHCENKTEKKTLLIAFLSGLAPCSFAWSIYFLLLSLGKLSLILPLIIALGLGILTTLIFIVIITVFLKEKSLNKIKYLSEYSIKISAIIILIISIYLLTKTLNISII